MVTARYEPVLKRRPLLGPHAGSHPACPPRPPVPFAPALLPVLVSVLLSTLGGGGPDGSSDTYAGPVVRQAAEVKRGIVAGVRKGAVAPTGMVDGATGSAAGGRHRGSGVRFVERYAGRWPRRRTGAFEYIFRKPNGEPVSVAQ